jgi:hypothetical protein
MDASGASVANATVAVQSTPLFVTRSTSSGADGTYILDLLPSGTYEVTITAPGFSHLHANGHRPNGWIHGHGQPAA